MRNGQVLLPLYLTVVVVANAAAMQRPHPAIMQDIATVRADLERTIGDRDADRAETTAERIEGLFQEIVPIYRQMSLEPAVRLARKAAAAAGEAAAAARVGNMGAAAAAHSNIQSTCGECHAQFREKGPDGSYRFKLD